MLSVDHPTEWELFRDTLDKMNHHGAFSVLCRVYILKGLKKCGIVLIKIHLRDEITSSEHCEGLKTALWRVTGFLSLCTKYGIESVASRYSTEKRETYVFIAWMQGAVFSHLATLYIVNKWSNIYKMCQWIVHPWASIFINYSWFRKGQRC